MHITTWMGLKGRPIPKGSILWDSLYNMLKRQNFRDGGQTSGGLALGRRERGGGKLGVVLKGQHGDPCGLRTVG